MYVFTYLTLLPLTLIKVTDQIYNKSLLIKRDKKITDTLILLIKSNN